MKAQILKFEQAHFDDLRLRLPEHQQDINLMLGLVEKGPAWSAFDDGDVIAIGGIISIDHGQADQSRWRGQGWMVMDQSLSPVQIRGLLNATWPLMDALNDYHYRRIEFFVHANDTKTQKLLDFLLFNRETSAPMDQYLPNGEAAHIYARTKQPTRNIH